MDKLDKYVLNNIFDYVFSEHCIINIKCKKQYIHCLLISKYHYQNIKKSCDIIFMYKSSKLPLPILCECSNHLNKINNTLYIIHLLNKLKNKNHVQLQSCIFKSKNHVDLILPYLIDLHIQYFTSDGRPNELYIMSKKERYNMFL